MMSLPPRIPGPLFERMRTCDCGMQWTIQGPVRELVLFCAACGNLTCDACRGVCCSCSRTFCAGCIQRRKDGQQECAICAAICLHCGAAPIRRIEVEDRDPSVGYSSMESRCEKCLPERKEA